ncbi:MAG: HDOD domain-containing protein [Planctomycetota bacterium]
MTRFNEKNSNLFRIARPPCIRRSELRQLLEMLESPDCSMARFGDAVSKHPVVLKQLLRAANSSLTGSAVEISAPAHAALYLGSRRVSFLLNTLAPEFIDEDEPDVKSEEGVA